MIDNAIEKITQLYSTLQDELSREVFDARLMVDICPTVSHLAQLIQLNGHMSSEEAAQVGQMKERFYSLASQPLSGSSFIIYGTSINGRQVAEGLFAENIPFYGFCCRNAERFSEGMMGKPVISPEEVFADPEKYYVIPAAGSAYQPEIREILREHNFPEDHIIMLGNGCEDPHQYFVFPHLFHRGTAFIDGGCCNLSTSKQFASWCGGEYSKIIAFEPSPTDYQICLNNSKESELKNLELVQAGLSSEETTTNLVIRSGKSFISDNTVWMNPGELSQQKIEPIRTVKLDDFVRDTTVGFIKMDIEGAEYDALKGARGTIVRDRPFLAICVYHRRGDMIAIMDYLLSIVPEYRFWLRQHSSSTNETVLYASVD